MAGVNQYAKNYENESIKHMMLSSLSFILFLPFAVMWIAGAVRRLHDIGTFGWWVFIVLVPIYLFLPNWLIIAPLSYSLKMGNVSITNMAQILKIQMHQYH